MGPGVTLAAVLGVVARARPTQVLGSPTVDGYGTQWFYWFAGEVLAGRQAPGWTDLLFHPWGKDLYTHTGGNLLDAWIAAPLRVGLGAVTGFNLWIALLLVSNAWAGVRLAEALGIQTSARWVAGVALVLNPYVLAELDLGRPTQAWIAPAGLALAALMRMRGPWQGAVAGGWLGVTALAYWYYGLLVGVLAVTLGLWRVATEASRGPVITANLLGAAATLAATLPFAAPMLGGLDAGGVPGLLAVDGDGPLAPLALRTAEGDPQGLYVVAPLLAQAGSLLDDGGLRFNPGLPAWSHVHSMALVAGMGVLLWERLRRRGRGGVAGGAPPRPQILGPWLVAGTLLALYTASGPAWAIAGETFVNHPWIATYTSSDVLRRWWWPGRAVAMAHLLVAPTIALVLVRIRPSLARWGVAGVTGLTLALPLRQDGLLPLAAWEAAPSAVLDCLATAPRGAVIDLPLLTDQKNLWFQTLHGHPILGGMLMKKPAFAPSDLARLRAEDPLVAALDVIGEKQYTRDLAPATPEQRAAVVAAGYRYVLARIDAFARPRTDARGETTWVSEWSRPRRQLLALLGEPGAEEGGLAIWTLDGMDLGCE